VEPGAGDGVTLRSVADDRLSVLLRSARDGDDAAFAELVAATHAETWTLAMRLLGNAEDAADVVQETYIRAYRSLAGFRGDARFTTWLHRITANCAASHRGWRVRHRYDELRPDTTLVDARRDHDPQACLDDDALRAELLAALDRLPTRLRAVVVLRDVYDLPHEAIATELGISVPAAKVRLHRGRRRLRESLAGLGATAHEVSAALDAGLDATERGVA